MREEVKRGGKKKGHIIASHDGPRGWPGRSGGEARIGQTKPIKVKEGKVGREENRKCSTRPNFCQDRGRQLKEVAAPNRPNGMRKRKRTKGKKKEESRVSSRR